MNVTLTLIHRRIWTTRLKHLHSGPYMVGFGESFKSVCNKAGVQVHLKGGNTIKDLLMGPKNKYSITNRGGVTYRYECGYPGCRMEYTGETGWAFGDRYKEHLRALSPIYDHTSITGHSIQLYNFSIVDRESQGIARTIKEAMFIRVNDLPLSRKLCKYQLAQI